MTELLTSEGDLADPYRSFIAKSRYARWRESDGRRETWSETVDRYFAFLLDHLETEYRHVPDPLLVEDLRHAVLHHDVMPSMRALMTAGPALERSHIAGYNCAYLPIADPESLDELLYILMNGTGVGYSVESRYTSRLPPIPHRMHPGENTVIRVEDSKEGWAHAYRNLVRSLWMGHIPRWDMRDVRPAGARLTTFGGRASGPEPLEELFEYTVSLFINSPGRQLRPLEVHDLVCKIASVVVVGGVRRSAMLALSDLEDHEMAHAKRGAWWVQHPHRALANISAVYEDGTPRVDFDVEWANLQYSGSGERGIFHRGAAQRQAARRLRREEYLDYGTNPCSEIILRPYQFCNLSEVVVRPHDQMADVERKIALAAVLGTWQSTLTQFPYLRQEWQSNAEHERLLGVSLTGVYSNPLFNGREGERELAGRLDRLREVTLRQNAVQALYLDIKPSAATTCIKPSGTVSQLVGCESGLHQRHARYYLRRVRVDKNDPLAELMENAGVQCEEDVYNPAAWVFSFPQKASASALTRQDVGALEHLRLWAIYQRYFCEHKPSVTISVRPEEWEEVSEWVWENLHEISGLSFLPYEDHTYRQAPYEEISREEYEWFASRMPVLNWHDLVFYETTDGTTGSQELACAAGSCDIDTVQLSQRAA